jgi:hypothetical protein
VAPHGYEVLDLAVAIMAGFVRAVRLRAGQPPQSAFCGRSLNFVRYWTTVFAIGDLLAGMAEVGDVCLGGETPWRTAGGCVFT